MSKWRPVLVGLLLVVALSAFSGSKYLPASQSMAALQNQGPLTLTSSAFKEGEQIPSKYTCKGLDISPALNWTGAPDQTKSFALILDDPDAAFTHWVIFNIPSSMTGLGEAVPAGGNLPNGAIQGINDFQKVRYNGPCPPAMETHHYVFHLYALDIMLSLSRGASNQALLAAMNGHVLTEAKLAGLFG